MVIQHGNSEFPLCIKNKGIPLLAPMNHHKLASSHKACFVESAVSLSKLLLAASQHCHRRTGSGLLPIRTIGLYPDIPFSELQLLYNASRPIAIEAGFLRSVHVGPKPL
jgi:hypothetical protein